MEAGVGIHKAHQGVTGCRIDQTVDLWKRVTVLGTRLVEVCVINTHALGPIRFFNKDHIGHPVREITRPNEPGV